MYAKSLTAIAALLLSQPLLASGLTVDNASLEFGTGAKVQLLRAGVQSNWESQWFSTNGRHLGAFWDLSLAQWRGNAYRNVHGQHQNITVIGLTPTFRYQADERKGWYAEIGIGYHLLSELYNNDDNRLSTAFEFGDHLGAGYVFANGWEAGVKLQHFSNGGIKHPNSGVNFAVIKLSKPF